MWLRLAGANFSANNIGQLNKIYATITGNNIDNIGTTLIGNKPTGSTTLTFNKTITCQNGATISDVNNVYVYMNGSRITNGISIANNVITLALTGIINSLIINVVTTGGSGTTVGTVTSLPQGQDYSSIITEKNGFTQENFIIAHYLTDARDVDCFPLGNGVSGTSTVDGRTVAATRCQLSFSESHSTWLLVIDNLENGKTYSWTVNNNSNDSNTYRDRAVTFPFLYDNVIRTRYGDAAQSGGFKYGTGTDATTIITFNTSPENPHGSFIAGPSDKCLVILLAWANTSASWKSNLSVTLSKA